MIVQTKEKSITLDDEHKQITEGKHVKYKNTKKKKKKKKKSHCYSLITVLYLKQNQPINTYKSWKNILRLIGWKF